MSITDDISQLLSPWQDHRRAKVPTTLLGFDRYLRQGIPNRIGQSVAKNLGLDRKGFANQLHISLSTLDRRNDTNSPFRKSEADALYRLLRMLAVATRVLGSQENVRAWVSRGQPALDGRIPLELAETDPGADAVCLLLEQIHHGIVP